ncbi:MAG: hypothetical protein RLZZ01_302 [Actinomycetota bacterium]|jgi:NCAIR mutase (PurE)-related protein
MNDHLPDGSARLDLDRVRRIDIPEAVYCAGKTTDQSVAIVDRMLSAGEDAVLATRTTEEQRAALRRLAEPAAEGGTSLLWRPRPDSGRSVAVVSAGTSDLPVAHECRLALTAFGHRTALVTDVGVAGLHRLTTALPEIRPHEVIVAIAGMEGALPTVLAGLVRQPIVAVPTSVGYGTSFEGVTALLSMMSSCSPGVSVVGIDNGYGAACAVHRILGARP